MDANRELVGRQLKSAVCRGCRIVNYHTTLVSGCNSLCDENRMARD